MAASGEGTPEQEQTGAQPGANPGAVVGAGTGGPEWAGRSGGAGDCGVVTGAEEAWPGSTAGS